jgi:hypothetical protein
LNRKTRQTTPRLVFSSSIKRISEPPKETHGTGKKA